MNDALALVRQADVSRDLGRVVLMYPVEGEDHIGAYQLGSGGVEAVTANSEREAEIRHATKRREKNHDESKTQVHKQTERHIFKYRLLLRFQQ